MRKGCKLVIYKRRLKMQNRTADMQNLEYKMRERQNLEIGNDIVFEVKKKPINKIIIIRWSSVLDSQLKGVPIAVKSDSPINRMYFSS